MAYRIKLKTITLKVSEQMMDDKIVSAKDVFRLAKEVYKGLDDDQEHFTIFFLNQVNKVTGYKVLFSGGQSKTNVDIKIIFRNVLLFGAAAIISVHNHPSGELTPSVDDLNVFSKIERAGEILSIKVLDGLIISKDNFYSVKEGGKHGG